MMQISATDNTLASKAGLLSRPTGASFDRAMQSAEASAASDAGDGGLSPERAKALRKASQQLVATTFIQPMLAKMREDPFQTKLFHGGQAEKMFGQQLDTVLSERIVAKADFSIVDAVYRTIADKALGKGAVNTEVDTHA